MVTRGPQNQFPYLYSFELGDAVDDMHNVEEQTAIQEPPFPHTFKRGAERYTAGTAADYYDGYPQATWRFSFMPVASWQWIDTFFGDPPATSVDIFVRTKDDTDTYHVYSAKMHRPEEGSDMQRGIQGYYDLLLRFTQMVEQEE